MHPGPVNRGVELCGEVVDSPQAVITAQVEAGVVVRMAVLYEVLAGAPRADGPAPEEPRRMTDPLVHARPPPAGRPADPRRARPRPARAGIDAPHDVLVRDGEIAEIGAPGALERPTAPRSSRAPAGTCFPAFVDPHVHLRTPGQEHKEDLETGTRAAAAGGFCAVIAMPNTDPVVDSAPILRSLRDAAARDARIPVGFLRGDHARAATARS